MKRLFSLGLLLVSGCATVQPPVPVAETFWAEKDKTVVVVVRKLPQADFITVGQQGLLDIAINEGANSALNDYLHALDLSEFLSIGEEFKILLEEQGMAVSEVKLDYPMPELRAFRGKNDGEGIYARYDYRAMRNQLGADRLLLVSVSQAGISRAYYGFFATGEPMTTFVTNGLVVDLHSNRVLWRAHFDPKQNIQTPWDEPPVFPNVTSAFYKTLEQSRTMLRNDFRVMPAGAKTAPAPAAVPQR